MVVDISTFPVKKSGLCPHNPVISAKKKYNSLLNECDKLIGAVKVDPVFQFTITSGRLKGRGRMVKNIGMPPMTLNSRELSVTKAPLKNVYYYAPNKRVPE